VAGGRGIKLRWSLKVLPRLVLRMRRAVRHLRGSEAAEAGLSGAETEARWHEMIYRVRERDRAAEDRLARAERALNRLAR
jgi:hypothetical protein